jgi:UDP-N-acetylmuramyl pentapeptide phosphotransferase/UDP-N-acetylglucosamine-1-phosphate transferase
MTLLFVAIGFVAATGLSWLLVRLIRVLALHWNVVSVPNERSSHDRPMPILGGLAIVVLDLAIWLALGTTGHIISLAHALIFVSAALLIAVVSLIDDLRHVPYPIRLLAQGTAVTMVLSGWTSWSTLTIPLFGAVSLGFVGAVLSFLWMMGLTNTFNFMDGVDGMAAGQAVVSGLGWVILGTLTGHPFSALMGGVLAATSFGFLLHNWQPARIFMGDVGATFLGFSFAALPLIAAQHDPRLGFAGVLLVWPVVFDPGWTTLRRFLRREPILSGHRAFLFHRLVHTGWTHRATATLYLFLPVIGAFLAVAWAEGTGPMHEAVLLITGAGCFVLWLIVRREENRTLHCRDDIPRRLGENDEAALREGDVALEA